MKLAAVAGVNQDRAMTTRDIGVGQNDIVIS